MAKHTPERIEEIRNHLAELTRRGIPVARFAAEIGVTPWTIYSWMRRYPPTGRPTPRRRAADLIEVMAPPPAQALEVVIGDVTVRVPPGFAREDLEHVMQAVRTC
jgi:transposase-like protein